MREYPWYMVNLPVATVAVFMADLISPWLVGYPFAWTIRNFDLSLFLACASVMLGLIALVRARFA